MDRGYRHRAECVRASRPDRIHAAALAEARANFRLARIVPARVLGVEPSRREAARSVRVAGAGLIACFAVTIARIVAAHALHAVRARALLRSDAAVSVGARGGAITAVAVLALGLAVGGRRARCAEPLGARRAADAHAVFVVDALEVVVASSADVATTVDVGLAERRVEEVVVATRRPARPVGIAELIRFALPSVDAFDALGVGGAQPLAATGELAGGPFFFPLEAAHADIVRNRTCAAGTGDRDGLAVLRVVAFPGDDAATSTLGHSAATVGVGCAAADRVGRAIASAAGGRVTPVRRLAFVEADDQMTAGERGQTSRCEDKSTHGSHLVSPC